MIICFNVLRNQNYTQNEFQDSILDCSHQNLFAIICICYYLSLLSFICNHLQKYFLQLKTSHGLTCLWVKLTTTVTFADKRPWLVHVICLTKLSLNWGTISHVEIVKQSLQRNNLFGQHVYTIEFIDLRFCISFIRIYL